MLRFAGQDPAECLAYAELFDLPEGSFSLEPLLHSEAEGGGGELLSPCVQPGAGCSS
jgi:hypothetical protein